MRPESGAVAPLLSKRTIGAASAVGSGSGGGIDHGAVGCPGDAGSYSALRPRGGCSARRPDPAAMIAAIRSGGTLRQVAAQYGVSSSFVYGIVRKEGIQLRPTITEAQRRAIIEEAGNGSTIISLMRKYRIGYHRIRTIIDRSRTQPLKDSSRRLLEVLSLLQNTTLTFEQVGRRVGTSGQRIHQIYTAAVVAGIRFENRGR